MFTFLTCIYDAMLRKNFHYLCGLLTVSYEFMFTILQCESNVDVWLRIMRHYMNFIKLKAEGRREGNRQQGLDRHSF